jgi:hypothetical protein
MTGVQFSYAEGQQYENMFPNYRSTLPLNEARIDGLMRGMKTRDKAFWEQKLGVEGAKLFMAIEENGGGASGSRVVDFNELPQ